MNKKFLFLPFLLGMFSFAGAQQTKLYGYVQRSSPGMAERQVDEKGRRVKNADRGLYTYHIYLTGASEQRLYPVEMWIRGERLGVRSEAVNKTPVLFSPDPLGGDTADIILVPETSGDVLKLTGTSATFHKDFPKAAGLAKQNELVVVYRLKGNFQYLTLKSFTELESPPLQ